MPSAVNDNEGDEQNVGTGVDEQKIEGGSWEQDEDNGVAGKEDNFGEELDPDNEEKDDSIPSEENNNDDHSAVDNENDKNVGLEEAQFETKKSDTNFEAELSELEQEDGTDSHEQIEEKEDDSDGDLLSIRSDTFSDAIRTPPLPETDGFVRLTRSASKRGDKKITNAVEEDINKEEKIVEEKDDNEESRGTNKDEKNGDKDAPQPEITNIEEADKIKEERNVEEEDFNKEKTKVEKENNNKETRWGETDEENGDKDAPQAEISNNESGPTTPTIITNKRKRGRPRKNSKTGNKDGIMGSSSTKKKRKRPRLPKLPPVAATMNPMNQMNAALMMNPQMMFQQFMMAASGGGGGITPQMMAAANAGFPPAMMANNIMAANGNKNNLPQEEAMSSSCEFVTLHLPVDGQLGMILDDTTTTGNVRIKRLVDDSPIKSQIPFGFQSGCCIGYMKSERIGRVHPKSTKECVELIAKSKEGATTNTVTMEMLLVKTKEMSLPKKAAGRGQGNKNWGKHFTALQKYKEQYGNCNVLPSRNLALAHWVLEQRRRKHSKTLGNKRVKRLDLIGFDWDGTSVVLPAATADSDVQGNIINPAAPVYLPLAWDDAYEALVRFKDRCGLLPNSGNLHHWMEQQKKALGGLTNFFITQERAKKLLDLGMDLSTELADKLKCAAGVDIVDEVEKGNEGDEAEEEGSKSKRRKVCQDIPKETPSSSVFWKSAEAAKLFGYNRGDDILKGLQERVEVLKQANQSVDGWKSLIPDDGKEGTYSRHDILVVRHKAIYLIKGYLIAMKKMNQHNWGTCCKMASAELSPLGLTKFGGVAVASWNAHFRIDNKFPHPVRLTRTGERETNHFVRIFEYFPQAKEMFLEIANENKHQLSGRFMLEQFEEKILPTLERDSRDKECFNDGTKPQKMLMKMLTKTPSEASVVKWMRQLNIEWDQYTTMRGRGSYLSQRMAEAWAAGKYANRRPKGQGLKKGQTQDPDIVEDDMQALDNEEINIADLM